MIASSLTKQILGPAVKVDKNGPCFVDKKLNELQLSQSTTRDFELVVHKF